MPNEPNFNDTRNLWQSQEGERMTITLDNIRQRAAQLERRVQWRNHREYIVGIVVLAVLATRLGHEQGWRLAPTLLLIAAAIYMMFQIHRRGAVESPPAELGLRASVDFHIRELEPQRDALHSMWKWYLLPPVPGFIAFIAMAAVDHGSSALIMRGSLMVLVLVAVWRWNERAARKIDGKIQGLKTAIAGND